MDHLFTKFLAHIRNQETNKAVEMVIAYPILITMEDDELHLSPLHHALFNHQAPFYVISTFVAHWLLLEDLYSLTEMQLVHLACMHNAPFNVIHYLSSLFPASLTARNSKGYTPFMLALWDKLDKDIIRLLSDSDVGAIGDFRFLGDSTKNAIVDEYFGDEFFCIDSKMTMFRLEHKDPTLNFLVLSDLFSSIQVMDVLDAVQSHPHLEELILSVDHDDSILWTEGNARNKLFSVLRDLPSTIAITIRVGISRFAPVAEMITHCQHVKYLRIGYDGCQAEGYGMDTLVKSLRNLPVPLFFDCH
jgi:hypothetical protein